jgi:hypothetical protein
VQLGAINELSGKYLKRVRVDKLMTHPSFFYLSSALKDFKLAMKDPLESHAFVFRAIETIRVYYADAAGLDSKRDKAATWVLLPEKLGYKKEQFDFLTEKSEARRLSEGAAESDSNCHGQSR